MSKEEGFFVFRDRSTVKPHNFRSTLKTMLTLAGFNPSMYSGQSFCSRCASDLIKLGMSVDAVKDIGRWKLNAMYKYLKLSYISSFCLQINSML